MRRGVTEQVAYEIMRRQSQDKSMRMVDIAREILKTEPGYEERERKPAKS
jgi:response regulator NasT